MRYNGGKTGFTAGIIPIIRDLIPHGGLYWEPFSGSCKMLVRAPRHCRKYGSDRDRHIVTLLNAVRDGWLPPNEVTEEDYKLWQGRRDWDHPMLGFIGYGCCFGGNFFAGFIREPKNAATIRSSLLKMARHLEGVEIRQRDYREDFWGPKPPDLIYADPPYEGTTRCGDQRIHFDSKEFWEWADRMSDESVVLVSEYQCPVKGAVCLWEKTRRQMLRKKDGDGTKTERLFCLRPELRKRVGFGFL